MPLKFIKRLILSTVVSEGSKTPLMQRVAQKTARMEHDAPAKISVWARAAYVEVKKDAASLWAQLQGSQQELADKKQVESGADPSTRRRQ